MLGLDYFEVRAVATATDLRSEVADIGVLAMQLLLGDVDAVGGVEAHHVLLTLLSITLVHDLLFRVAGMPVLRADLHNIVSLHLTAAELLPTTANSIKTVCIQLLDCRSSGRLLPTRLDFVPLCGGLTGCLALGFGY